MPIDTYDVTEEEANGRPVHVSVVQSCRIVEKLLIFGKKRSFLAFSIFRRHELFRP